MNAKTFTQTATGLIASAGTAAHHAIGLYRESGERLAGLAGERWKSALKESGPKLSAETRKNAAHAQQVFAGYYARGLAVTADGAEVVVDTVVGAAITAVERAAALQQAYTAKAA